MHKQREVCKNTLGQKAHNGWNGRLLLGAAMLVLFPASLARSGTEQKLKNINSGDTVMAEKQPSGPVGFKEKPHEPITVEYVKKQLGDRCSDSLAGYIVGYVPPQQLETTLKRIKTAFVEIDAARRVKRVGTAATEIEVYGEQAVFDAIGDANVAKLFVEHTDAFVEIAKAAKSDLVRAFGMLGTGNIPYLFERHPDKFVEIAKVAKGSTSFAFWAFLNNDNLANLFDKNPELVVKRFAEMAKAAGSGAFWAFESLIYPRTAELFVKYPDKYIEFTKAVGKNAEDYFYVLRYDIGKPELFVEFAEGRRRLDELISSIPKYKPPQPPQ